MSMRVVYKCDVCRDEVQMQECYGMNFYSMKKFKIDEPSTTQGVHICFGCLKQLEVMIPKTKASITYTPDSANEGR